MNDTQNENSLATLQQQVTALADPAATLQAVADGLGAIWNDANARGDQQAIQFLDNVWARTNELANNATVSTAVARAALETAQQMSKDVADLQEQVDGIDGIYDIAYTDAYEGLMEQISNGYYGELYFSEPGADVFNVLTFDYITEREDGADVGALCTIEECETFMQYLAGNTILTSAILAEKVARFIREFNTQYHPLLEAERELQRRQ